MISKLVFTLTALCLSLSSFALVDYSEPLSRSSRPSSKKAPSRAKSKTVRKTKSSSKKSGPSGYALEVKLGYEAVTANIVPGEPSVSLYRGSMHIQTPYNIYFDGSYFYGATDSPELSDTSAEEAGNPEFKLGVNWLQFGGPQNASAVDLFVGTVLAAGDSHFATTSTDYFVGLETKKRFMAFALGLGYQYHMTGTPSDKTELDIGNVHYVYGEIGWQATYDIVFAFEAGYYSMTQNSGDHDNSLESGPSFSYFSPKLNLSLAPSVGIDLGAVFSGKSAEGMEDRGNYKLWGYKGLYGDSLFANLIISI
ncbi:MAG: hypothetical protein KAG61_04000 [Bacteriovoracaceae bacterium]|nr:hypothetical protein [Bacteriovoracaceae bacterium]